MRIIYVDEAGTSVNDPVVVVAGIIINADKQWRVLEDRVNDLIEQYVPADKRDGFVFHGTELFSGGKNFPRTGEGSITKEESWQILEEVVSLPREAQLPIMIGYWPAIHSPRNPAGAAILGQCCAYAHCLGAANIYLNVLTGEDDIANVVAENNNLVRKHLKQVHRLLQRGDHPEMPDALRDLCPIDKIKDTVHFAEKSEAILLQLADVCAFVTARYLAKKRDSKRFFEMMVGACPVAGRFTLKGGGYFAPLWGPPFEVEKAFASRNIKIFRLEEYVE